MVKLRKQDFHFQKNNSQINIHIFHSNFHKFIGISHTDSHGLKTHKTLILLTGVTLSPDYDDVASAAPSDFGSCSVGWISSLVQPKWFLVGGFNPFEKYSSKWESSPNRGGNKKYLKPPPSFLPSVSQEISAGLIVVANDDKGATVCHRPEWFPMPACCVTVWLNSGIFRKKTINAMHNTMCAVKLQRKVIHEQDEMFNLYTSYIILQPGSKIQMQSSQLHSPPREALRAGGPPAISPSPWSDSTGYRLGNCHGQAPHGSGIKMGKLTSNEFIWNFMIVLSFQEFFNHNSSWFGLGENKTAQNL